MHLTCTAFVVFFSPLCCLFFPIITFTSTPASAIFSSSLLQFFPLPSPFIFLYFCFLSFNFPPCPVPTLPISSFTYFPVQLLFLHNLPLLSRNTLSFHFLSFAYIRVCFLSSHLLTSPARSRSCCLNFLATDPLNRVDVIFGAVHRADG